MQVRFHFHRSTGIGVVRTWRFHRMRRAGLAHFLNRRPDGFANILFWECMAGATERERERERESNDDDDPYM